MHEQNGRQKQTEFSKRGHPLWNSDSAEAYWTNSQQGFIVSILFYDPAKFEGNQRYQNGLKWLKTVRIFKLLFLLCSSIMMVTHDRSWTIEWAKFLKFE